MSGLLPEHRLLLSICIPVYNHASLLREQFEQLDREDWSRDDVEFVVVDDASADDVSAVVDDVRERGWRAVSIRHEANRGRAAAMAASVRRASGEFMMFMDADDKFEVGGLHAITASAGELQRMIQHGSKVCGLVFGTTVSRDGARRFVLPPDGVECSLLSLRADLGVRGDLKELVRSDLVKAAICPLFDDFRRVPTSLIWARVSDAGPVLCHARVVVNKVYLPGGMTRNIDRLRAQSVRPLLATYRVIAESAAYDSLPYRARAAINYHRFRMWHPAASYPPIRGWLRVLGVFGDILGWAEAKQRRLR
jgi:glycosyltransferase involved in cell wall biosynthesis